MTRVNGFRSCMSNKEGERAGRLVQIFGAQPREDQRFRFSTELHGISPAQFHHAISLPNLVRKFLRPSLRSRLVFEGRFGPSQSRSLDSERQAAFLGLRRSVCTWKCSKPSNAS
jgi:hypothetical protein